MLWHVLAAASSMRAAALQTLEKMSERIEITNSSWDSGTGEQVRARLARAYCTQSRLMWAHDLATNRLAQPQRSRTPRCSLDGAARVTAAPRLGVCSGREEIRGVQDEQLGRRRVDFWRTVGERLQHGPSACRRRALP